MKYRTVSAIFPDIEVSCFGCRGSANGASNGNAMPGECRLRNLRTVKLAFALLVAAAPLRAGATPLQALVTATFEPGIFFSDFQYNWQITAQNANEDFNDFEIQMASVANLNLSTYTGPGMITPVAGQPNLFRVQLPNTVSGVNFSLKSVSNPTVVEGFPDVTATLDGNPVATTRARAPTVGTLVTSAGADITGSQLASWINEFIPNMTSRFINLIQCFGGNVVSAFDAQANTAVASGTSPGEVAHANGYDVDTAKALKPGTVGIISTRPRNAQDVQNAGISSANSLDHPISGGGLALSDFSLENTSATGNVQSRHVLFFAAPSNLSGIDTGLRNTITNNFAGQANTTVTTVGLDSMNFPATAAGLRQSLQQIGNSINASPDPSKEQFILYAADHGDEDISVQRAPMPVAPNNQVAFNGFPTFTTADLNPQILLNDPNDVPGFTAFIPFGNGLTYTVGNPYVPFFHPGDWEMLVDNGMGATIDLTTFQEKYLELGDGIIGDQPGEGIELFFPVDKTIFTSDFFNTYADITLINHGSATYSVDEFDQDSGDVARVLVPEPGTIALLGSALLLVAVLRQRRSPDPVIWPDGPVCPKCGVITHRSVI